MRHSPRSQASQAQEAPSSAPATPPAVGADTLFQNVRIFDGKSAALSAPSNVLMPGLIDAHWHAFMASTPQMLLATGDPSYLLLLAARQAEATLMRGFTTVRDLGGPVFGLKRAIDEGVMMGPRIYPSGAFISQTSGHGDFRFHFEVPRTLGGPLSSSEVAGVAAIADTGGACSPSWMTKTRRLNRTATADNGELLALSGFSNPYPGKLGVVEEGALADLHQTHRRSRQEPSSHHEGWQDLEGCAAQMTHRSQGLRT